jgi:hypothetical protein
MNKQDANELVMMKALASFLKLNKGFGRIPNLLLRR